MATVSPTLSPTIATLIGATDKWLATFYVALPVFAVLFLCCCFMRKRKRNVYEPNTMEENTKDLEKSEDDKKVLLGTDSLIGTMKKVWLFTDDEIENFAGFDALAYIKLLWAMFRVCAMSLPIAFILMAIYGTDNQLEVLLETQPTDVSFLNKLTLSNVKNGGWRLWIGAFLAMAVFFTAVYILTSEFKKLSIRVDAFNSKGKESHHTVCMYDIPDELKEDGKLRAFLDKLFPGEVVNTDWMKDVSAVWPKWVALEAAKEKLKNCQESEKDPKTVGMLCLKKDIEACTEAKNAAQEEFEKFRYDDLAQAPVAFVQFKSMDTASLAATSRLVPGGIGIRVREVPDADGIFYQNLHFAQSKREISVGVATAVYVCIIIFFSGIISFATSMANIENLAMVLGPLDFILDWNDGLKALISGLLPVIVLAVFFAILPIFLVLMEKMTKPLFSNDVFGNALIKYADCLIGMGLLLSVFTSGIFANLDNINEGIDFGPLITSFGSTLPGESILWINYLTAAAFITMGLECSLIIPLVLSGILGPNQPYFDFYKKYAVGILMFTIATTYAVIAPFVMIIATIYFFIAYNTYKYQLMYVYKPGKDTGAKSYPKIFGRLFGGMMIGQLILIVMYSVKKAPVTPILVLLPIITYLRKNSGISLYGGYFNLPSLETIRASQAESKESGTSPVTEGQSSYVPQILKDMQNPSGASASVEAGNGQSVQ